MPTRACAACGAGLPERSRADRLTCSARCRTALCRLRQREAEAARREQERLHWTRRLLTARARGDHLALRQALNRLESG